MNIMRERFKIYIEQLRDGHVENLAECYPPEFLDVHERDLAFNDPVDVKGEAYLADDMLVLHLDAHTYGTVPCRICNEPIKVEIAVKGFYHAVPFEEIKTGIFDFHEVLRETIILAAPALAECHQGKCPQRLTMQKYFRKEGAAEGIEVEEGYQPFADLDFNVEEKKRKKR